MRLYIFMTGLIVVLLTGSAFADGISVNPGLWEMKTVMTMSMMPQPHTNTVTECIKEDQLDPDDFNMDEDNPCQITNVSVDGNSASWSISCPAADGMAMDGQWQMTSSGDSITGGGSMAADFAGQKMNVTMKWDGKRIGDCKNGG